jgi:hypothetical protein
VRQTYAFSVASVQDPMLSPSMTETTVAVKSNASAEKVEMKKPKVDTERTSSLRLKWRATHIPSTPNNEAENTVQERHLCIT